MRTLLAFIWRHQFILIFILLELTAGIMIIRFNRHHSSAFFTFTRESSSSLHETMYDINAFFALKSENRRLAAQNAILLSMSPAAFLSTDTGSVIRNDSLLRRHFRYTSAEAISNSVTRRNNFIILNKGSRQGIAANMGVISSDGVVGIVSQVSPNFSSVISVLHQDSRISVEMKSTGFKGYVSWNGLSYRKGTLSDIPSHAPLHIGDTVVTSSDSQIFPHGVMVGTVTDFRVDAATNFYHVNIEFSCDYNRLRYVFVVENLHREELDQLIEATQPDSE